MNLYIQIINQIVEIEQKLKQENLDSKFERNFNRISSLMEEEGYIYKYPLGEKYNETRTDCDASIIGNETENMIISQVIKPIIYKKEMERLVLVQKGIVLAEKA